MRALPSLLGDTLSAHMGSNVYFVPNDDATNAYIAKRILHQLVDKNMTRAELARQIDIAPRSLYNYFEDTTRAMPVPTFLRITRVLDMDRKSFFDDLPE